MFSLQNKKTVITGGGSGIGEAIALLLAAHGADVQIIDLNEHQANATVAEIRQNGGQATAHVCDVSSHQAVLATSANDIVTTLFA